MIRRLFAAAAAVLLLVQAGLPADADIVLLRDGSTLPSVDGLEPGAAPSLEQLKKSGRGNLTLEYTSVRVGRSSASAAQVEDVFCTLASMNADFKQGEVHGSSGSFDEAAQSLAAAAEELKDADRQLALRQQMVALRAAWRDPAQILAAADRLIVEFPKGYYYPEAQTTRAIVLRAQGKEAQAKAAYDAIINAPGMNARDYFEANLAKVRFFEFDKAGNTIAKYAAARASYERIVSEIDRHPNGKSDADIQRLKALVGIGKCYVFETEYDKARKILEEVTSDPKVVDKTLLGSAYKGLGDAIYAQAKAAEKSAGTDEKARAQVMADFEEAGLHYLRVILLYGREYAPDEIFDATRSCARVFANLFLMGGEKDCALGYKAYNFYRQAWQMLDRGELKSQLGGEAKDFKKSYDAACKDGE